MMVSPRMRGGEIGFLLFFGEISMSNAEALSLSSVLTVEHFARHGLRLREVQARMARRIEDFLQAPMPAAKIVPLKNPEPGGADTATLHRSAVAMIEAGTGTGKTLAYLIPLLLDQMRYGGQVAVSTYTRHLQRQILRDDLQKALQITGSTATVAMRIGRSNFVSRSRVRRLHERLDEDIRAGADWQAFFSWVQSWDEATDPLETTFLAWRETNPDLPMLGEREMSDDMVSLDEDDPEEDAFWFEAHAKTAQAADVVVTNHATLLIDRLTKSDVLGGLRTIVVDEADRLPDAAKALWQRRIRWDLLLARAQRRYAEQITPSARQHVDAIMASLNNIGQELNYQDIAIERLAADMPDAAQELLDHMRAAQIPLSARDAEPVGMIVEGLDKALKGEFDIADTAMTLTFSPMRRYPGFAVDPIDVRNKLKTAFQAWESTETRLASHVILTSATLSDPMQENAARRMTHIEHEYGIDTEAVLARESYEPSRYGHMSLVLPDPRVPGPMRETVEAGRMTRGFDPEWIAYVLRALDANPKRKTLMLCPSFTEIADMLRARTGEDVLHTTTINGVVYHMQDTPAHKLLQLLRDPSVRAIVTPSFWEGVNLVVDGRLWVDDLMISRLPIPPFSEVLQSRQCDHMVAVGAASNLMEAMRILFFRGAVSTLRKMRQGVGRGIRGQDDRVRLWLLDPRCQPVADWRSALAESDDPQAIAILRTLAARKADARHPVYESWHKGLPMRFQGLACDAPLFTQDGQVLAFNLEVV